MKSLLATTVITCALATAASGAAIPLASISNEGVWGSGALLDGFRTGDRFVLYSTLDADPGLGRSLFENTIFALETNGPAVSVEESVTAADDVDFAPIVAALTDGMSFDTLADGTTVETPTLQLLRMVGGEDMLDVLVPRISASDLFGYEIERIDRRVTMSMVSPGRDLDGNGVWTDFQVEGVYEFYGHVVPEPATLVLLVGAGALAGLGRRRGRPM